MRQKDDNTFTGILNRIRTASPTENDITCIQSTSISPLDKNYPSNVLHIWAENNPVTEYNNQRLQQILSPLFVLKAVDQYPQNVTKQNIDRVLLKGHSETGGLDSEILIKQNARVLLISNIDISERLINGQIALTKIILFYSYFMCILMLSHLFLSHFFRSMSYFIAVLLYE